mgnify:CR=1 FL=1
MKEDGMFSHYICYDYKDLKEAWEQALEAGVKRNCPSWGVGGLKDEKCNCGIEWCYFWGKEDKDLDKADSNGSIYSHNVDWETNSNRWPFLLPQINEIDDRWPKDDDLACKQLLHKFLAYKEIKAFINKYGWDQFYELCENFPTVENHGYDLDEVMTMDLTLIHRN